MSWYVLYPKIHEEFQKRQPKKRCLLRKAKPLKPVSGYGFAEGPLKTLNDVSRRLNAMNVPASRRPVRQGRVV